VTAARKKERFVGGREKVKSSFAKVGDFKISFMIFLLDVLVLYFGVADFFFGVDFVPCFLRLNFVTVSF
jgi:hypothetical protein